MRNLKSFEVSGLFRRVSHKVEFNLDPPVTIIAGPNGAGKTHLLRLLRNMLDFDVQACMAMQFDSATLTFSDGRALRFSRKLSDENVVLKVETISKAGRASSTVEFEEDEVSSLNDENYPPYIVQVNENTFWDTRSDRAIPRRFVEQRWGVPAAARRRKFLASHRSVAVLLAGKSPILIDTKRLDSTYLPTHQDAPRARTHTVLSPIKQYIEQVRAQVNAARNESLVKSQQADRNFAARALDTKVNSVPEGILREKYKVLSDLHSELYKNGLAAQSIDVKLPEKKRMVAAERRILAIFLDDWEKKLHPLLPINSKLNSLRRIVNQKFIGKELVLNKGGELAFESSDGEIIPVDTLSSGEQHILALFTMLLFSASSGSVVLIDEPEISLHAAWKHAFLDDIEEVARLNSVAIVLATHSSAIINGRWELVQELGG